MGLTKLTSFEAMFQIQKGNYFKICNMIWIVVKFDHCGKSNPHNLLALGVSLIRIIQIHAQMSWVSFDALQIYYRVRV